MWQGERDADNAMCHDKSTTGEALTSNDEHMFLLDTLSDAVIFLDKAATILSANKSATAIVGAREHELIGKTLWQTAPQFITTAFYQAVVDVIHTHIPSQVKYLSPVTRTWLWVYLSPTKEGIALFFHEETKAIMIQDSIRQSGGGQLDLLEVISERVAILTPQGLLLEINQQPLNDTNVQREEVIGKPFSEFPSWSYSSIVQEQWRHAIVRAAEGDIVHFEVRACWQVGRYIDLAVTLSPHSDGNQQVDYLICAGQDITERKQVDEALRDLLDMIPHNVWIAQPDGSIIYDNQRLVEITPEQVEDDDWMTRVHLDDLPHVQHTWYTSIHTGQPYEAEYRQLDSTSGAYHWVLARGVPQRDEQGTILSWIGTATDIDAQKQAEERIQASEQGLRVLTESLPQLVWAAQPDGRIDYINQQCYDFVQTDFSQIQDFQ
jgi:PAS domain S-box-containing protein